MHGVYVESLCLLLYYNNNIILFSKMFLPCQVIATGMSRTHLAPRVPCLNKCVLKTAHELTLC